MVLHFVSNYKVEGIDKYSTVEEVYEYCKDKKVLGIDIETSRKYPKNTYSNENIYQPGLDPYLSRVIMIQLGDRENIFVIDARCVDISILIPLFESKNIQWVGHNLRFESKHLKHTYGVIFKNIWDTMVVEMNLTNGLQPGYSLAKLSERYLNIKNVEDKNLFNQEDEDEEDIVYIDKSTRLGFINIGDNPFTPKQILYGADDIDYPLKIRDLQLKGTFNGTFNPIKLHMMENEFCLVLADIELRGVCFDPQQWLKVAAEKQIVYNRRLKLLNDYVVKFYPNFTKGPDLFNQDVKEFVCNIQWSSSQQVIEFFKYLGFCPKEKSKETKKLEYTVGAKSLLKLLPKQYKDEFIRDDVLEKPMDSICSDEDLMFNYLLLKRSEQAVTTFGKDFLKYIHPITKRIHTSYKQILNTGRISSYKPNVQNIPAEVCYRQSFIAPENHILINADYASQESRDLAEISGDQDMLDFFNLGHPIFKDDYHSFTATKMFRVLRNDPDLIINKKDNPDERQAAKNISFKIAYGGSAFTLKDDFGVEEEVAQQFIDSYFDAFPSLRDDFIAAKKKAVELGYIEIDPITKRRWYFKEFSHMQDLNKQAWSLYPEHYKEMSQGQRIDVKEQLKIDHPELKDIWSEYFSLKGKLERDALNFRIQGLAASQMKMSGIIFRRYIIEHGLEGKFYLTSLIHDEALAESHIDFSDECMKVLEESMVEGGQKFCKKVKMAAEAVKTMFWHH